MSQFPQAELIERIDFSEDLGMFKFRPIDMQKPNFIPGQYATIGLEGDDGKIIWRPYSIVSSPYEDFIEFYIELVPNGKLTPRIWKLKVGDKVWIRPRIVGKFNLVQEVKKHIFAATVTGAAPFISMIRTQIYDLEAGRLKEPHRFLFIHGASRSKELGIYRNELTEISKKFDWLIYIPTVSRPWEDPEWTGETGRVEDVIRKYSDMYLFSYKDSVVYACGNPDMIQNVKGVMKRAKFPEDKIEEEKYY
ncbi:MAG: ferredoxin--NADP reductase [Candidatus Calescibacterium sp.]|nr:ferredoxin--NADP reductase [Candidatus Calescibacterium sp.]MCX7734833.1 ferredoxin--NADP reductase [bacterium]